MVARVRPDSAGIPPAPAPPAGHNGQSSLPGEQAPRPAADATLPQEVVRSSLGRFSTLLGQPYQRLKVAVLRELSSLPTPHWPLVRAETVLDWLEPAEASRLLDELREEELLVPAPGGTWRLSEEAQLVAAVCAVLAVQSIEPERVVKVLCAATSLALAAGTEDEPAIAPFLAAVDVLDADFDTLLALIDLGDVPALRSISRQARAHAADMAILLERERPALDALRLTSSRSQCLPALVALESWLERPEPELAPLPQPRHLDVEPIDVVPDFVVVAGEALRWLASMDGATLSKWVVGGTWAQAVTRMAAAVEAWSRWGPIGDGSLMASLEPRPLIEPVGHDEVGVASHTGVRGLVVQEPSEEPPEPIGPEQRIEEVPVAVPQTAAPEQPAAADPPAREEPAS